MTLDSTRLGIYVHVPFCIHKCSYCDFYSFTKFSEEDFQKYSDAVVTEIEEMTAWYQTQKDLQPVHSIFFGGGTPSLLPVKYLKQIFDAIAKQYNFKSNIEITLEANPETVTENLLKDYKNYLPVNRISLGAQSFSDKFLKDLERLCRPEKVREAAGLLAHNGFENFNLDLIFGIGSQKLEEVLHDIEEASKLNPNHISFYNLTLTPGHRLFKELPGDDGSATLFEAGIQLLESKGYMQYEISNFAKPGCESRHNLLYWNGDDYMGFGPSAAGRYFLNGTFHHQKRTSDFKKYLLKSNKPEYEVLTKEQTKLEALFLEIRKNAGISLSQFKEKYGWELSQTVKTQKLLEEEFFTTQEDRLWLTKKGLLVADKIAVEIA